MTERSQTLFWVVLAIAIFTLSGLAFYATHEQVEETYQTPAEKEARLNPYLAAERFLKANQLTVESTSGSKLLDSLPPTTDTIVLANHANSGAITPNRAQALHDWIAEGGHLITIAHSLWDEELMQSDDNFLDEYGVRLQRHDYSYDEINEIPAVETTFAGNAETLTLGFIPQYYLVDHDEIAYSGIENHKEGYHLLQIAIYDGILTVVSDDKLWRNQKVGKHDHALFLHNLIHASAVKEKEEKPTVWIVHDLNFPSLLSIIWNNAAAAVVITTLLLIFSLWAAYNRFGPPLIIESRTRRSLVEHIDASAHHHWRHDGGDYLLATLRQQINQLVESHHPQWTHLSAEQQIQWLSKRTDQPEHALSIALHNYPKNEHEFTKIVQILQRLRKTL